jgi:hypothetical protein
MIADIETESAIVMIEGGTTGEVETTVTATVSTTGGAIETGTTIRTQPTTDESDPLDLPLLNLLSRPSPLQLQLHQHLANR